MYDMSVITRDFIKRVFTFQAPGDGGHRLKLTDREGHLFVFSWKKVRRHSGAGRNCPKGVRFSPAPVDKAEWKGMMCAVTAGHSPVGEQCFDARG